MKLVEVSGVEKVRLDVRRKECAEGGLETAPRTVPRRRRHDHRQPLG
jgi:hypothetical protein